MNILLESHQQFLFALLKGEVDFIMVGGYAVIYHGYGRTTGDMDLWLNPNNENKVKLLDVLNAYGVIEEDLKKIEEIDFSDAVAFHLGEFPERIDFLTQLTGLNYTEAFRHKDTLRLKEHKIPILRYEDLIVNKLLSNRTKDKADVEELQKIMKLKNDKRK